MLKYEYLIMVEIVATNYADICDTPKNKRPAEWTTTYYVCPPGSAERYERPEEDFQAVLNELGSQGWQLLESTVTHSRSYDYLNEPSNFYGHKAEVAAPIRTRYIFMREVQA